jgi:outer membrane biosynthesis protein TonB
MDTSTNPAVATQESTETPAAPIRLVDSEAKKHFDSFEAHFFQQGDEASLAYESYEDPDPRIKRWLPYRTLLGISIASTTVAVVACIALWRNSAHAPASVIASAPAPAAVAPVVAVAQAAAAPAPAPAEPAAQPVAADNPAPAAAAPAVPPPSPVEIAKPVAPAAAPTPDPSVPALAQAEQPKAEQPKAEQPKAEQPKTEPVKAEAPVVAEQEKAKPEAPVVATAPGADSEARARCRQSIHDKRAKDIAAVCSAAFEQDATDAEAAVAVAKVEFDRGRFSQAYAWSKKAIAAYPSTADAYVFAGGVEQNQGRGKAAKESYLHYLRLAPSGRYAAELRTIVNSL